MHQWACPTDWLALLATGLQQCAVPVLHTLRLGALRQRVSEVGNILLLSSCRYRSAVFGVRSCGPLSQARSSSATMVLDGSGNVPASTAANSRVSYLLLLAQLSALSFSWRNADDLEDLRDLDLAGAAARRRPWGRAARRWPSSSTSAAHSQKSSSIVLGDIEPGHASAKAMRKLGR